MIKNARITGIHRDHVTAFLFGRVILGAVVRVAFTGLVLFEQLGIGAKKAGVSVDDYFSVWCEQ